MTGNSMTKLVGVACIAALFTSALCRSGAVALLYLVPATIFGIAFKAGAEYLAQRAEARKELPEHVARRYWEG